MSITYEILALVDDWDVSPQEINRGECGVFMDDILRLFSTAEARDTGPTTTVPGHYWVFFEGKHYG